MSSSTAPTPPTRRHATPEVRRAQILDAAQACFSRSGYHRTTMDDIVRESGLSKGSLYWHFKSKDEVLLAIFDRYAGEFFAAWEEFAQADPAVSIAELLVGSAELFMERIGGQQGLAQVWLGFLEHPVARERLAEVYTQSRAGLAELLQAGIARGELQLESPDAIAAGFTGLAEGLFLQAIVEPGFDPTEPLRISIQALLKGITR